MQVVESIGGLSSTLNKYSVQPIHFFSSFGSLQKDLGMVAVTECGELMGRLLGKRHEGHGHVGV